MKKAPYWQFAYLLFFAQVAFAQTNCTSGVINIYTPVLAIECAGTAVEVDNPNGFMPGDEVLLIQMKGAIPDSTNTATFGEILDLRGAGNYELTRINSVKGNLIQLEYKISRAYNLDGKVQLIRVPEYNNLRVCDLTCAPWDGEKGGVLVLDVKGILTLEGDIFADKMGFRGGRALNQHPPQNHQTNYFYPPQPDFAGEKGEGFTSVTANKSFGRGKLANGGGGGNAHNAGGGGGGGFGRGGDGGQEFSHTIPDPNTNGIGGMSVTFMPDRLLLGGGGGAGQTNDLTGEKGGNGGGIILILAGGIDGNGFTIRSNGEDVFGGSNNNDGQGGGGAGGVIAINAEQIEYPLKIEAKGGRGGNSIFTQVPTQLIGPGGGGGGGGFIRYFQSPDVPSTLSGGQNGLANGNIPYNSKPGSQGTTISGAILPIDTAPAFPPFFIIRTDPSCIKEADGSIEIIGNAQSYSINGGQPQSLGLFSNLPIGNYEIHIAFSNECGIDTSIVLTSAPNSIEETTVSLCQGDSYLYKGIEYTAPALILDTTIIANGCDSLLIIELIEVPLQAKSIETYLCPGDSLQINGQYHHPPKLVLDTIQAATGCDTLLFINLKSFEYVPKNQTLALCPGERAWLGGQFYQAPTSVTDTLFSSSACDTIRVTELVLAPFVEIRFDTFLCPGEYWVIGHKAYAAPALVVDTIPSEVGCDTIRIVNIEAAPTKGPFLSADTSICSGESLTLSSPYAVTTWQNGQVSQNFDVREPGLYIAKALDENNCPVRDSILVTHCCLEKGIYVPNSFSPDASSPNDRFRAYSTDLCRLFTLSVYDRWGELIFFSDDPERGWNGTFHGKPCPTGVYVWVLALKNSGQNDGAYLKGDVTLVR